MQDHARDRTRGNGFKLKGDRFRRGIKQKIFPMVRHSNRFHREAVDVLSLEEFKGRLDLQPDLVDDIPAHGREAGTR